MDDAGKTWFFDKVANNEQGIGSGNFTIPTDAKTGNYKLLSYTSWSKNNKKAAYFSQDLLVINPFIPLDKKESSLIAEEANTITIKAVSNDHTTGSSDIKMALNAQTYYPREEVTVDITTENSVFEGSYGSFVRQVPAAQSDQKLQALFMKKKDSKMHLPEIKGELISGTIKAEGTAAVSGQLISLSIPGEKSIYKLTETNQDGRFNFLINQPYDSSEAILQVLDKAVDHSITVDENLPEPAEKPRFKKVIIDPSLTNWITEQSTDLQIENASRENNSAVADTRENQKFYHPFATRYTLDDYTRFPSMHETFTEVVELAAMRIEPDQVRMLIYNPDPIIKSQLDKLWSVYL